MLLMTERSENVSAACTACGGGDGGFLRRTGPGGHAEWCPTHNEKMRPLFVRHSNFITPARIEQKSKIEERKEFAADLFDDGYTVGQIAEILGVSSWTVRDDLLQKGRR